LELELEKRCGLSVASTVGAFQSSIDHVEVCVTMLFGPAPQHAVRVHVELPVWTAGLFQTDQIIKMDVVQIEFEVVAVIIKIVEEYRKKHPRSVDGTV